MYGYYDDIGVNTLLGQTLEYIKTVGDDEIHLRTTDGKEFKFYHPQGCCESVTIEDVCGDLADLVGSPITIADEVSNSGECETKYDDDYNVKGVELSNWPQDIVRPEYAPKSYTWTFYKLATVRGSVTIRWFGSSNGYYSEGVSFVQTNVPNNGDDE
jgi:hypothetical protein